MPARHPGFRLAASLALLATLTACSSGIEGKYYNSMSGELAMELKGGKVVYAQGMPGRDLTYRVRGDSLVISDPSAGPEEQLTFGIEKDGTLSLGMMGSLTKKRP